MIITLPHPHPLISSTTARRKLLRHFFFTLFDLFCPDYWTQTQDLELRARNANEDWKDPLPLCHRPNCSLYRRGERRQRAEGEKASGEERGTASTAEENRDVVKGMQVPVIIQVRRGRNNRNARKQRYKLKVNLYIEKKSGNLTIEYFE